MPLKIFLAKLSRSVSRILSPLYKAKGNHSSRLLVTEQLKRPTRKRRPNRFGQMSGQLKKRFPIWSCTARSLPSRACYQTRWRALTASFHPSPFGWSVLCCTCRRPIVNSNARMLSGSLPYGVRTFLL